MDQRPGTPVPLGSWVPQELERSTGNCTSPWGPGFLGCTVSSCSGSEVLFQRQPTCCFSGRASPKTEKYSNFYKYVSHFHGMLTACEGGLNEEGKSGCYFRAVFLQALVLAGGVSPNPPPQPTSQQECVERHSFS